MLPSPDRRSKVPVIREIDRDPSPLLARTSDMAGIDTMRFAEREPCHGMPVGRFHVDDHPIAVLFGADLDRGGFLLVVRRASR